MKKMRENEEMSTVMSKMVPKQGPAQAERTLSEH
jgi:hypothetical protein